MALLRQGQLERAALRFADAVHHDPTAADAWLGLHATGRQQAEAVDAMEVHRLSFGALRTKCGLPFSSRFSLEAYATFRLETARDLWLAGMAKLLSAGRIAEAEPALLTAVLDCDETRFLCTRFAFLKQNWPLVLDYSRGISDRFLNEEAQLYAGHALVRQHVFHQALNTVSLLPRAMGRGGKFDAEVAYVRGLAHEGLGDPEEALRQFQYAFRCSPGLADVAERAQARLSLPVPVQQGSQAAAPPAEEADGDEAESSFSKRRLRDSTA
ncbi:hypothetical protein [Streptomyces gardneri]|uniref:hypothetical protein n=1 Tax=Streptomyces gardneri TaxID=66892 RepID=UPI00369E3FB6